MKYIIIKESEGHDNTIAELQEDGEYKKIGKLFQPSDLVDDANKGFNYLIGENR